MSHLQKLACRCEVTAVKFICKGTILLTAQGPFLTVYNATKGVYIATYPILHSNKIHGIRTHSISFNETKYIIITCFGSKELCISLFNTNTLKIQMLHTPLTLDDWIFDAKLLSPISKDHDHEFELVIGMMHTQVLLYSVSFHFNDEASISYSLIDTTVTDNTSILYSLSFHGSNRNNLMIAAGDCFNHLLLWNVFDIKSNKNEHQNKSKIKFRGRRKGAIYDISWSKNGKYLSYVSDDRSVQLWKFNDANTLQMVYRVYGHQGRVFKCWISSDAEYIVSCSEDSTCKVWNFDGELIETFEFRYGAIWSVDVCFKKMGNMNLYHVALGGADTSIRFHYFLSKNECGSVKTISLNANHNLNDNELTPFQHHLESKVFYELNLPHKYFPKRDEKKSKKRGKKRNINRLDNIRIMLIDSKSRIVFATASDVYRVSNLSALSGDCKWEKIIALKDIFAKDRYSNNDEITTIKLSKDLFSDYGHFPSNSFLENVPSDLLSKYDISTAKYARIPEDESESLLGSQNVSQLSLNANIKKTDRKIAANLHFEYERWLVIGTKVGRICIVDLNTNQNTLCFRAHDISIVSIYLCITSFQPETLENINISETEQKYRGKHAHESDSKNQLRFSLSASDLHRVMSNPSLNDEYLRMWGNSSLMLFTSDGNGHIAYWCFPLSELQKPKDTVRIETKKDVSDDTSSGVSMDTERSRTSSVAVKYDEIQSAIKSSATFMNPAKKQICSFCYLPPPKNLLIVGDARGNVMLFSLLNLQKRAIHKPMQVLKSMHGREPVSVIRALRGIKYIHDSNRVYKSKHQLREEESESDTDILSDSLSTFYVNAMNEEEYHIVSGGKDGKIVEYTFYDAKDAPFNPLTHARMQSNIDRVSRSEHNLLNIMNDIEKYQYQMGELLTPIRGIASTSMSAIDDILMNDKDEMICSGFRSTYFVVWNVAQDYVLFKWNCGGVKRPHYYYYLDYGWIFAYTNSNLSMRIAVYDLDLSSFVNRNAICLGSIHKPYHSSEIHAMHWLLAPQELYSMCRSDDIFTEIEAFVADHQELQLESINDNKDNNENEYVELSTYFKKVMIVSSGEDGLIEIIPVFGDKTKVKMEQNEGSRFPLKCCDIIRKSSGDGYLVFGAGAKQYLQGFEITFDENRPERVAWKALCSTGGDRDHKTRKRHSIHKMNSNNNDNMDLRIKSVVVLPNPKYYRKWLIITGNSRGIIRAYTLDEDKPSEFQFEGEDSMLHLDNNASSPILSLCSTYCSETNYHFQRFAPFNYNNNNNVNGIIANYNELPPHLLFSGATDGWIRIWYWNMDAHSIQSLKRLAIHQNGVNSISVSWLDATFIKTSHNGDTVLNRRLAILSGGDDQSLTLVIAQFESTSRKRPKRRKMQWKFNVLNEIPINTAHCASIRSVAITPIITQNVAQYFNNYNVGSNQSDKELQMDEILLISTGDDQMLKCWYYYKGNLQLLDQTQLHISIPNCLSIYYIYNSGILISVGGKGMQIVTLDFKKYKIFQTHH